MRISAAKKRECSQCGVPAVHMVKPTIQDRGLTMTLKWMCLPCFCHFINVPLTKKLKKEMNEVWFDDEK